MTFKVSLVSLLTAVIWLVWAVAGVAGLRLQYQQAQARLKENPPIAVEKLDVRLVGTPASAQPNVLPSQSNAPPALPLPDAPAAISPVTEPSPTIPFAVPVNRPATVTRASVPVEHLIFGTGVGNKPAPEYPREAKIVRQQGTVVVRFRVDPSGHVIDAEAAVPCPYALLNQAAVRAVRETWDFPPGRTRVYDVTFQFELR